MRTYSDMFHKDRYIKNQEKSTECNAKLATIDEKNIAVKELMLIDKCPVVNPFQYTSRVSIELSNLCNYANIHKKCPLSLEVEKKILSSNVVMEVINTLGEFGFTGTIAFHTYNEPLIDPRLFKFIEQTRKACPACNIYILTNGYYLTQMLALELMEIGVSSIHVSAYTSKEYDRLSKIKLNIPYEVEKMILMDQVLAIYQSPFIDHKATCFAPLNEIIITREGDISLCCRDWQRRYTFGNLYEKGFNEIMKEGLMHAVYKRLKDGDRFLDICRRCSWTR
jgi:radical SAM protein with 4Fe4S-binding SPASM domain